MCFLRRFGVFCHLDDTQEHPAEVSYHAGVLFALRVALHLCNVLMVSFSMFITHCCKVWLEEVEVEMEKN